jgi:hypothetical protein
VNGPAGAFTHSFFFAHVLIALIGKYYNTFPRHWGAGEECFRFELESGIVDLRILCGNSYPVLSACVFHVNLRPPKIVTIERLSQTTTGTAAFRERMKATLKTIAIDAPSQLRQE